MVPIAMSHCIILILGNDNINCQINYSIKNNFNEIVVEKISARWNIMNQDGDISSDFVYRITNAANTPLIEFHPDREGFSTQVDYHPRYCILNNMHSVDVIGHSEYERTIPVGSRQADTFYYDNTLSISPEISPKSSFELLRQYDVLGSEKLAFTDSGAYAGLRIFYQTIELAMVLNAPPHYGIELLDYYVGDENGHILYKEKKKQFPPKVNTFGSSVSWRILYPKYNLRYWLRYRLIRLG